MPNCSGILPGRSRLSCPTFVGLPAATLALGPVVLAAQEHHHHGAEGGDMKSVEQLGHVTFPTSCATGTTASFERGIALMHSFWYEEAAAQLRSVAAVDPQCAMAQWGLAMTEWRPLWDGLPERCRARRRSRLREMYGDMLRLDGRPTLTRSNRCRP